MKARLAKKGSEEYDHNVEQSRREPPCCERAYGRRAEQRERQRESFNPPRVKPPKKGALVKLDDSLAKVIAKYQHSLNNPDLYTEKQQRRLKRKAKAYIKRIQAILQAQNERTPDRKIIEFFYVDANVARKKDCKLPKRTGYGLRVAAKNNNPKRGRAVLPLVNPAYVTSWSSPSDKLMKDKHNMSRGKEGYINEHKWERHGNNNGNGNGKE